LTDLRAFVDSRSVAINREHLAREHADKVENNCASCHTLAYIVMNSSYRNAATWDADATKMIKAFWRTNRRC